MKKFDLVMKRAEIRYRDRARIKAGCTIDSEPERIASFNTLEEAMQELAKHRTSICVLNNVMPYCLIEEYIVEANEYDEAGEWIAGGDVLAISPMSVDSF